MKNKLIKLLKILLTVFLIHAFVFTGYGWFANPGCLSNMDEKRILVVFGNKVYMDGTLSPVLKSRLDKALDLWVTGCYESVFVSGGFGKEGIYEGDAMAQYLEQNRVNRSQIIVDNEGNNSYLTALHTKSLTDTEQINKVTVVTSYYHVVRAMLAMKLAGVMEVNGAGSHYLAFQDIIKIPRDIAGFYVYTFSYGFK